jgi:hypothetical protein
MGNKYTCEICQDEFYYACTLHTHMLVHEEDRPFKCDYEDCSASFKRNEHLVKHKMIHDREKTFTCDYDGCTGKSYSTFAKMISHIRETHTDKPYRCTFDGCESSFANYSNWKCHEEYHSDDRKYMCQECEAYFKTQSSLYNHKLIHGDKRYKCEICDISFSRLHHLKTHMAVHTGEQKYCCDLCESKFTQSASLNVHRLIHSGERPHKCLHDNCDEAFTTTSHLYRHVERFHTEEGMLRKKLQEVKIEKALKQAGIDHVREHTIDFRCIRDMDNHFARIDFVIQHRNYIIFLEVDEDQHRFSSASCDMNRMSKIIETLAIEGNTLPIVFIRYNPNAYRVDGELQKVLKKDREEKLIELLSDERSIIYNTDQLLSVLYMYYDMIDGEPEVFTDEEYNNCIKECCLPSVF